MAVELTPNGTKGTNMPQVPRAMRPLMKPMMGLGNFFMRLRGSKLLELTTVGAKSGREHTVTLGVFPDKNNDWLVVGSNMGAARHPAWVVNMAKNPDKVWADIGKGKVKVEPESLKGAERDEAWKRIVAASPGYGRYVEKTDREIPIIRLKRPAPSPS